MAGHQVTEFARRLHVSRAVSGRASEYCRLAEFKCPGGSVSTSCMAVVSLELAASRFGEVFDKVLGVGGVCSSCHWVSAVLTRSIWKNGPTIQMVRCSLFRH